MNNKLQKIMLLNFFLAAVLVVCFSEGLLALGFSGHSIFVQALSVTIIIMCALAFFYGNYKLLFTKEIIIKAEDIKTPEEFLTALERCSEKRTFKRDMETLAAQIVSFRKKRNTIQDILLQYFDESEMTFQQFHATIDEGEALFYSNIRSIINRLNAFDENDYLRQRTRTDSQNSEIVSAKMQIYNEYIEFVKQGVQSNERILLKLDMLLSEASKLGSMDMEQVKNAQALKEIDDMISNLKWYR